MTDLNHLIDVVVGASSYGAGRFKFTERYPAEACAIRALQPNDSGIVALLNRAIDQMECADDPNQRYRRYEYARRVSATIEKLEALRKPAEPEEIPVVRLNTPVRREMITAAHLFPREVST